MKPWDGMSGGSVFGRDARVSAALAEPETNGKRPEKARAHTCPRCRWKWLDGDVDSGLDWPGLALDYLHRMTVVPDAMLPTVRVVVEAGVDAGSVVAAAKRLHLSRRALTRRFTTLPAPSKWVGLAVALATAELTLHRGATLIQAAERLNRDRFGLSNTMLRYTGMRPSDLKDLPAPIWREITDGWLDQWEKDWPA